MDPNQKIYLFNENIFLLLLIFMLLQIPTGIAADKISILTLNDLGNK